MTLVEDRFGVAESVDDSMRTTNDLMSKYKDLKGIMSFGSQGPIGAGVLLISGRKMTQFAFWNLHSCQGIKLLEKALLMGIYFKPYDCG